MDELFFCSQTGEPLTSDIKWFRCLQCGNTFMIKFRFEDKPVCRDCAVRTGAAALLDQSDRHSLENNTRTTEKKNVQPPLQQAFEQEGFRDNGNGTVTQLGADLIWMRFSLGQHWQDGKCIGKAKEMSIPEAEQEVLLFNKRKYLGASNWRIPSLEECATLLNRANDPAINLDIFPGTPTGVRGSLGCPGYSLYYWTSTSTDSEGRKIISYLDGEYAHTSLTISRYNNNHVRLVSGSSPQTSVFSHLTNAIKTLMGKQ